MPDNNIMDRVTSPMILTADYDLYYPAELRSWPFEFDPVKQNQWMSLSRACINELMHNRHALLLLAFSEHVQIPDEMYFSTFLNSNLTAQKMLDKAPTWAHFGHLESHPYWVSVERANNVDPETLFVRKVNLAKKLDATRSWIDSERNRVDIELGFKSLMHGQETLDIVNDQRQNREVKMMDEINEMEESEKLKSDIEPLPNIGSELLKETEDGEDSYKNQNEKNEPELLNYSELKMPEEKKAVEENEELIPTIEPTTPITIDGIDANQSSNGEVETLKENEGGEESEKPKNEANLIPHSDLNVQEKSDESKQVDVEMKPMPYNDLKMPNEMIEDSEKLLSNSEVNTSKKNEESKESEKLKNEIEIIPHSELSHREGGDESEKLDIEMEPIPYSDEMIMQNEGEGSGGNHEGLKDIQEPSEEPITVKDKKSIDRMLEEWENSQELDDEYEYKFSPESWDIGREESAGSIQREFNEEIEEAALIAAMNGS